MKVVLRAVRARRTQRRRTRPSSEDGTGKAAADRRPVRRSKRPPAPFPGDDINVFELSDEARVYRL